METRQQDSIPDRPPPLRRSTRIQKRDEKRRYEELERKEMESRKSIMSISSSSSSSSLSSSSSIISSSSSSSSISLGGLGGGKNTISNYQYYNNHNNPNYYSNYSNNYYYNNYSNNYNHNCNHHHNHHHRNNNNYHKKKSFYYGLLPHHHRKSNSVLKNMPLELLIYLLEFLDGPSLAAMEQVSRSFFNLIRSQHSPYRFLYHQLIAEYNPLDDEIISLETISSNNDHDNSNKTNNNNSIDNDNNNQDDIHADDDYDDYPMHPVHAPVLPKISRKRLSDDDKDNYNNKKDAKKFNVSDWKIQFVESYKYYVTEVCTVCGQPGEPIPVWEVRLCRFCVVRQLINKSALTSFSLTSKEYEVLKPWKTFVYDLGMYCTFYLRNHLEHLRRQKYMDPQIYLDLDVQKRQAERFTKEITKRKRKQREQEQSYAERTHAILRCFKELRLKAELSVMEEWWFPKELKLEIQEYISNKTNNSLARKRLRLSDEQNNNNNNNSNNNNNNNNNSNNNTSTNNNNNSSNSNKNKASRKSLDDIMHELKTVVVPRVERLKDLNFKLISDGVQVDKLRLELDLKTRKLYDEFVLAGSTGSSSYNYCSGGSGGSSSSRGSGGHVILTASKIRNEIISYREREKIFESSVKAWYSSITNEDFLCCELEPSKFLRDARDWWAKRCKKPPPEKCGELYLARLRKRQLLLKKEIELAKTQENWRRQLLERKLREKIDWYFTELPTYVAELRKFYEKNLERRLLNKEIFWMKGIPAQYDLLEPPERLKHMYCEYEDFIKNYDGFCSTEDGYCGCLEYAAKDIVRANTVLRRKEWMDMELRQYPEINYKGPEQLLCPEAREEYYYSARNPSVPKRAAVKFIARAEDFMKKLLKEVPTFSPELITAEARASYKRFLGIVSDFYNPPRRPCSWTAFSSSCYYYEVHTNSHQDSRSNIRQTIRRIKDCEDSRLSRLEKVDSIARKHRLVSNLWNKSVIKRPLDGVSFQTRVRWISSNTWFSLNQLAQSWIYDEELSPLSQLEPFIKENVRQMEKENRKEDINTRIKNHHEYQAIFKELNEDPDFFLGGTYEISAIYKVSSLYKAHVEDVKIGIDPDKVVRQVIDLIKDVKTGVISKSSLFVADRENFGEEDDDDDDDDAMFGTINNGNNATNGNNNNVIINANIGNRIAVNAATTNTVNVGTNTVTTLTTIANTSRNANNINSIGINSIFNNINAASSSNTSS